MKAYDFLCYDIATDISLVRSRISGITLRDPNAFKKCRYPGCNKICRNAGINHSKNEVIRSSYCTSHKKIQSDLYRLIVKEYRQLGKIPTCSYCGCTEEVSILHNAENHEVSFTISCAKHNKGLSKQISKSFKNAENSFSIDQFSEENTWDFFKKEFEENIKITIDKVRSKLKLSDFKSSKELEEYLAILKLYSN